MGKNKSNKKRNVFKVAGAKSLKAKSKARAFTGNIKKIKEALHNNIIKIDKDLVHIQQDIQKKKEDDVKMTKKPIKLDEKKYDMAMLETEKQNNLLKLKEMTF